MQYSKGPRGEQGVGQVGRGGGHEERRQYTHCCPTKQVFCPGESAGGAARMAAAAEATEATAMWGSKR